MRLSEAELIEVFTGLVVESLAVKQDFGAATVGCRRCEAALGAGDCVTVALSCYEDHSWEIQGVSCGRHPPTSVAEAMGVRAENQAVVAATLTAGSYDPPRGATESGALVLEGVEILEYSPTAAGY